MKIYKVLFLLALTACSSKTEKAKKSFFEGTKAFTAQKYEDAITHFSKSIETDPGLADAYYNRANTYIVLQKYNLALKDVESYIKLKPTNATAYFTRGLANHFGGKMKAAIADYTKAIELDPAFKDAYFNRSMEYLLLKDTNNACFDLRSMMDLGYNKENKQEIENYEKANKALSEICTNKVK